MRINPPPNWPQPPKGWQPPEGWRPDASWPPPPPGWQLWLDDEQSAAAKTKTRRSRRKWFIAIPVVVALLAVAAFAIYNFVGDDGPPKNPDAVRLGFSGLESAYSIAADLTGAVYVIDSPIGGPDRVLKLDANSSSQQELLRSQANEAGFSDLATDDKGNLYVVQEDSYYDNDTNKTVDTSPRLWRIDTATSEATSVPLSGKGPEDVAVGSDGELYIQYATDTGKGPKNDNCQISRKSGFTSPESPETSIAGCYTAFAHNSGGFAVDSYANMYIVVQKVQEESDYQWYVVKIARNGQKTVLPDVGTTIAVDAGGTIYGVGSGDIRALKPGRSEPDKILGTGTSMFGIAPGPGGVVYVTDSDEVFRIPVP
ncbi:MAG TPA: hypothetical protein VH496_06335 [Mycobacterium sp.]|jgi:hypothetical protein